jgi:hypothetical protein
MIAPMVSETASPPASAAPSVCPTCGAKRTRPDSTLCAYCATPFDLVGARPAGTESPNLARLARMKDQPGYDEAQAWKPLESFEHQALAARKKRGLAMIAAGVVLAATALVLPAWMAAIGAIVVIAGLGQVLVAGGSQAAMLKLPLLVRPAIVIDRRSETEMGFWNGRTTYFFAMEFADGSDGEFRWPGRGLDHQPLVNGQTGLAFTRGDVLLGFRAIRV